MIAPQPTCKEPDSATGGDNQTTREDAQRGAYVDVYALEQDAHSNLDPASTANPKSKH
jgi:hypothetical protein